MTQIESSKVGRSAVESPVIIVGTGLAGYTVARELRKLDSAACIVMITQDDGSFYSKPTLSNALAMKKEARALATFDAAAMSRQLNAVIRTHQRVERILPAAHEIIVAGEHLRYSKLVLATGADPRRPTVEGDGAADILSINDLGDYVRFRDALKNCRSVAILGAGLIGCEFANDLASNGYHVSVIDPASTPLSRLLPKQVGVVFARGLDESGIRFHLGRSVATVERHKTAYRLNFSDGGYLDADLVVSAIGLAPRTALPSSAGIEVEQGISTDAWCRTNAPDVYALGDCAAMDGKMRPYVLPIMHSARALARTLTGDPTRVNFPIMPITIKTPATPAIVVSPEAAEGEWLVEAVADLARNTARAIYKHPQSKATIGFALLGSATEGKAALIKAMTPTA